MNTLRHMLLAAPTASASPAAGHSSSSSVSLIVGIVIAVAVPVVAIAAMVVRMFSGDQDLGLRHEGTTDHFGGLPPGGRSGWQ